MSGVLPTPLQHRTTTVAAAGDGPNTTTTMMTATPLENALLRPTKRTRLDAVGDRLAAAAGDNEGAGTVAATAAAAAPGATRKAEDGEGAADVNAAAVDGDIEVFDEVGLSALFHFLRQRNHYTFILI